MLVIVLKVREESSAVTSDVIVATSRPDAASPQPATSAPSRPLNHFFLALFIFTLGNASDAFLLLRAQDLGVPVALIPLLWSVHHVSKVAWSVPGGAFADRFGARPAILSGWLLYAVIYGAFALASSAWHAWALFLAYGLFFGLTESPEKALVAKLAGPNARGSAFGTYHFIIGMAALPASLMFGFVWQQFGAPAAFLMGAGLSLFAVVLYVTVPGPNVAGREA